MLRRAGPADCSSIRWRDSLDRSRSAALRPRVHPGRSRPALASAPLDRL